MLFKDLKQNYTTYHLHRGEKISVTQGNVTSVSAPRVQALPNPTAPMNGNPFAQTAPLVVDVTIEEGGSTKTYTIPETLDITYSGSDLVIATSKEKILAEVQAMKNRADEAIASVSKNERISDECQAILEELDPNVKEKRENDERMLKMETRIDRVTQMMESLLKKLS